MHASMLLILLMMMALLSLFGAMYNLYKIFLLVTTTSGSEDKEVASDSIAFSQSNHKYNSDNKMYHFFVRSPHLASLPRHPLIYRG
jgi:hypothetical protein